MRRYGLGCPSTRASRPAARRPTRSSGSGRSSGSTASSRRLPPGGSHGFTPKELQWILVHAPSETVILRPDPTLAEGLHLARSLDAVA